MRVVALTKVVERLTPGIRTIAPLLKPVPVTVTVEEPTGSGLGETEVMDGPGGSTATYTVAEVLLSEASAVTVMPLAGIAAGAVYMPSTSRHGLRF